MIPVLEAIRLIVTRERAAVVLAPYREALADSIDYAWQRYLGLNAGDRADFSKRTRANILYDFMVSRAKELLPAVGNVRIMEKSGHARFIIEDAIQIKMKKLDRRLRPSNIMTKSASDFLFQVPDLFPEFLDITNVVVGYRLNVLETAVEGTYAVCLDGDDLLWQFEIGEAPVLRPAIDITKRVPVEPHRRVRPRTEVPADDTADR